MKITQIILLLSLLICPALSHSEGLSTAFADVVIKDVPIGEPYVVYGPTGAGLVLKNLGKDPIRVGIRALVPSKNQLRGDAQPIPDSGWVRLEPADLTIPPGAEGFCRISLHIPKQSRYRGQFYQVMIWSQGLPVKSSDISVRAGLLSRLSFRVKESKPE